MNRISVQTSTIIAAFFFGASVAFGLSARAQDVVPPVAVCPPCPVCPATAAPMTAEQAATVQAALDAIKASEQQTVPNPISPGPGPQP